MQSGIRSLTQVCCKMYMVTDIGNIIITLCLVVVYAKLDSLLK